MLYFNRSQCYGQLRTGTPAGRLKKGLDIEGICDNSSFMEWKLEVQADFVFKKLLGNKEAIYKEAMDMAQDAAAKAAAEAAAAEAATETGGEPQ